jgi:hypothetical protein
MLESNNPEPFYNRKIRELLTAYKVKTTKGLIGLEIECEGTHLFDAPFSWWSCHQDGSLRTTKGHPPVEYVLRQPLDPKELREALEYLEEKLLEYKSTIVQSNRTSVHVHVNCLSWTIRQLYCYILLYLIFEEILVEWSGPDRAGNLFCLRALDSEFYVSMLEDCLKQSTLKVWREDQRYAACNVAAIPKFGSLEFRSLRGTVDKNLILTWVDILLHLRKKSLKYDNPTEIVEEFIQIGPLPFFRKIFDDDRIRGFFEETQGLSGKLWAGMRLMRDVSYTVPWDKKKEGLPERQDEKRSRPRYLGDQWIDLPGSLGPEIVRTMPHDPDAPNRGWIVVDRFLDNIDDRRTVVIPPGHTMYYVAPGGHLGSVYVLLDMREGPPEMIDNTPTQPQPMYTLTDDEGDDLE